MRFLPQHLCYGSLTALLRGTSEGLNLLYEDRPERYTQAFTKLPLLFPKRNPIPLAVPYRPHSQNISCSFSQAVPPLQSVVAGTSTSSTVRTAPPPHWDSEAQLLEHSLLYSASPS